MRRNIAVTLGVVVLLDVLRVFLPSIITIFGQAASTPAELMGAFALAWFAAGLLAPPLAARVGPARFTAGAAVALVVLRVALLFTDGGQPQLYLAAVGLLAGICWLTGLAMDPPPYAVPTILAGTILAGLVHGALGTVDPTWWGRPFAEIIIAVEVLAFLWYALRGGSATRNAPATGQGTAGWLAVGPLILLTGMIFASPALAQVVSGGASDSGVVGMPGLLGGGLPLVVIVLWLALEVPAPLHLRWRPATVIAAIMLVAAVAWFSYAPLARLQPLLLFGGLALASCVATASWGERVSAVRHGYALAGGILIMGVFATVYYAAYDLGYPNGWVPVLVAALVAGLALRAGPARSGTRAAEPVAPERPVTGLRPGRIGLVAAGVALVLIAVPALVRGLSWPPEQQGARTSGELRLVAYNIRMGFGLDGTFKPDRLADAIAGQRPDIVVLGEVDRAWMLNGGHDTLDILARKLDMRYLFAPAADGVWGDAVLTNLPILDSRRLALSDDGAVTGAQALGVVVRVGDREVVVVGTHLQPPPNRPPLVQSREVADFANRYGAGRPTAIAGDLNIEPGSESWRIFESAGYSDGLDRARPVLTMPADVPTMEIDHVLVRGFAGSEEVDVPRTTASDHLAVAVTLKL